MDVRPLGRTGLTVSTISLGGAAVGQQYGPVTVAEVADTVRVAADAGINLIDTSAFYGEGKSEQILGEVLSGGLREKFAICTKAGRHTRDRFDFTQAGMRACLEGSLKRLRTDRVEILLAHDIEYADDFERVFTDTADVLHRLKAEGKCRFVGMSCYPLCLLRQAVERCNLDVVISYCHYNLQNRRLFKGFMTAAISHGVGVLNASPLAMGLLTDQGPPPWHPAGDDIKATCRKAAEVCRQLGGNIAELGMQFCVAEERIPSTITGTAKADELAANLAAVGRPLDEDLLAFVEAELVPVLDRTWASGKWAG
jgi:L-galactose dehydrogenase